MVSREVGELEALGFTYDASGFLVEAAQGARAWTFDYDTSGRLASATDPMGRTDSLFYDTADRVTRQLLADGEEIGYGYDASGRLASLTSGAGVETGVYDAQDRLTSYDGDTLTYTAAGSWRCASRAPTPSGMRTTCSAI